ncbi:MAG: NAD(P)/FAD-dependent oxidoreductase [Clostridiaceae bacterium]|nr:NAD(P)/FAD-dependent oxidoreductase [Clostridiaceae bacterium]
MIGNSAVAVGAIEGIRKIDKKNHIVVISDEPYHTYSRPLISYYLAGKVAEENMYYRDRDFYGRNGVKPILGTGVRSVDFDRKTVVLCDGREVRYSKLLIATGGKPFTSPIENVYKENVFSFTKLDDVKKIEKAAARGARAVVVGASFSRLKAVEALVHRGVKVTVIDIMDRIMPRVLDETASSIVLKTLGENGVELLLKTTVERILGDEKAEGVLLSNKAVLACDFAVLAIGTRCNTDLVKGTKIKVNRGILVDGMMRTSEPDVYAAGDVAEGYNFIEERSMEIAILPSAYKKGETAGINMAGGERIFEKGFIMNSMPFLGLSILSAGLAEQHEGVRVKALLKEAENTCKSSYKKFYIKGNRLVGYLLVNGIDRAGIYTDLIRREEDISPFEDSLGGEDFGLICLPKDARKVRMLDGLNKE